MRTVSRCNANESRSRHFEWIANWTIRVVYSPGPQKFWSNKTSNHLDDRFTQLIEHETEQALVSNHVAVFHTFCLPFAHMSPAFPTHLTCLFTPFTCLFTTFTCLFTYFTCLFTHFAISHIRHRWQALGFSGYKLKPLFCPSLSSIRWIVKK